MIFTEMMLSLFIFFLLVDITVDAQYRNYTTQYTEAMSSGTETLIAQLETNPDVNLIFNPASAFPNNDYYVFDYPLATQFRLGLLVDPCRFNNYDCCMEVFGTAEYPALLNSQLQQERVFKYIVIASDTEVSKNYYMVDEDGNIISSSYQRSADDYEILNTSCISLNNPYPYCQGRNYAYQRAPLRPACMDNNYTLDVLAGCYYPNGTYSTYCVQIAYSSNTYIPYCQSGIDHCGTYLEIHMAHGTPYTLETDVISSVQLLETNRTGYYTTVMPLTWMNNQTKVLCTYTESVFRIGSLVYIQNTAPVCCCPPPYQSATRKGSFQCPIGATNDGAFAYRSETLADVLALDSLLLNYPFCSIDLTANYDLMMCAAVDIGNRRSYTRQCLNATKLITDPHVTRIYGSADLDSLYEEECPYYRSCAVTKDSGKCHGSDLKFTFIGRVGMVTAVDNTATIPLVWVSFNNNRTSYEFEQQHVVLETQSKSMYEIWWVTRSQSYYSVLKRKAFNISNPQCTFDSTNNRYFPYAILNGTKPLDSSLFP